MGAKQTKGCAAAPSGASPPPGPVARRKGVAASSRERGGDLLASLVARSGEKFGKGGGLPPYHRRIGMIQDMLRLVKQGRQEEATDLLRHLRQNGQLRLRAWPLYLPHSIHRSCTVLACYVCGLRAFHCYAGGVKRLLEAAPSGSLGVSIIFVLTEPSLGLPPESLVGEALQKL
uniref:Uncharacterized protein n=1 Tax=Sphaerodactylus townsendi TaxID=933632 RepID=A0ACB8EE71_9SAUR